MNIQGDTKNVEKDRKKSLKVKGRIMNKMIVEGINTNRTRNKEKMCGVIKDEGRTEYLSQ